jgi:hypothetical protein
VETTIDGEIIWAQGQIYLTHITTNIVLTFATVFM